MALHENMKSAKIIEEIIDYLLENGYRKIETCMDIMEKETIVKVVVYTKGNLLSKKFNNDLSCYRDVELEEYGWELSNDISYVCTLDTLGLLIDNYEVTEDEEKCIITLHRIKK